jgi:pimeloyl-ACP methyl ester carboxylesterase
VAGSDLRTNPDALPGAGPPRIGHHPVNGTNLYAEVRGSGPAVILIGAADEDAEIYRPIAERLVHRTVVTYERRGTGFSFSPPSPQPGSSSSLSRSAGPDVQNGDIHVR